MLRCVCIVHGLEGGSFVWRRVLSAGLTLEAIIRSRDLVSTILTPPELTRALADICLGTSPTVPSH
jgi:hypothetical protein